MTRPHLTPGQYPAIILGTLMIAFGLYTLFWPVGAIRYLDPKIAVLDPVVHPGGKPTLNIRYCKTTTLPEQVTGTLYRAGQTAGTLGKLDRNFPTGCPVDTTGAVWQIPADTKPGRGYAMCFTVVYAPNAFRTITRNICTTDFEVAP